MELRRRFVFRGNAAAIGGRIVRPNDIILDPGIVRARSRRSAEGRTPKAVRKRFGDFVSYGAASSPRRGACSTSSTSTSR